MTASLQFVGVAPCRLADTRGNGFSGAWGPPFLTAGVGRDFPVAGQCGIPVEALAVSANLGAARTQGAGHLSVYPQGGAQPVVSSLNYVGGGQMIANAAVLTLGQNGGITVIAGVASTDFFMDVNGYYIPAPDVVTSLNGLTGDLTLVAGSNVSLTATGASIVIDASTVPGPAGPQGPAGSEGAQGDAGPAGPQGLAGAQGDAGPAGPQGAAGPQGNTGPAGPQGAQGDAGPTGSQGAAGAQGDTGPAGPQGAQGDAGPVGPQGPAGAQGDTGPVGPQGTQGDAGPTGSQGAAGAQGDTGPAGPQGAQGDAGPTGSQGPQGAIGPVGPQGPQGVIGPQGPAGATGGGSLIGGAYGNAGSGDFLQPWSNVSGASSQEAQNAITVTAGTASTLVVTLTTTPGTTVSVTVRKNFVDTALTCTIAAAAQTCKDSTNTVAFADNDLLSLRWNETSSSNVSPKVAFKFATTE